MPCNSVNKNLPEVVCNFTDQVDTLINSNQSSNNSIIRSLIQNNSNFNRLQRIIAYIYRFIHNLKNSNCKLQGSLSTDELDNALTSLLLSAQADMFPIECNILKSGKSLPHKNRLISLTPFKTKWSVASDRKLREGTLVLIREKALPPLVWALGRVVRTYAGVDGITRVADVKTKRGVITRGFNNICPLPFEDVNRREDVHASTA
ncbi:hypothetical protein SFRURICE_012809 [Spodoptera frugiperda]|nr:hypothetical protein SFRURICE_012809 [Spodoptera frugiperda]